MEHMKKYILLQINDALFPIGAGSHSYGLETYIQKGMVRDEKMALNYVKHYISQSLLYGDLLAAKLAWEICSNNQSVKAQLVRLRHLDERITASKAPLELRQASENMGSKFLKILSGMERECGLPWKEQQKEARIQNQESIQKDGQENEQKDGNSFLFYAASRQERWKKNYPTAYGCFCANMGLELEESLRCFLYAQTSELVTSCVKMIPLSETVGQKILYRCLRLFDRIIEQVKDKTEEEYGLSLPGMEIRSMQHENLHSRLYMS